MTWLGKILTIVIFLGSLAWAFFTVQSYVLSTNWKAERDKYKAAYDEARAKRTDDHNRHLAIEDALRRQIAHELTRNASLSKTVETLSAGARKANEDFVRLEGEYQKGDINAVKHQANIVALISELTASRDRTYLLEDQSVKQAIATEEAKADMVRAQNSEKLAQSIAAENARKVDDLQARLSEMRLRAGGGGSGGGVLPLIDKPPPPVLPNLRGEVLEVAGDLATIDIGIDAGLAVGTVLELYRTEGGGRYLGTVKVTDAFNLYAKQAVVKFTPASGLPLARLRPEEMPRKGDLVRPSTDGR
jgi:hypothetical protein